MRIQIRNVGPLKEVDLELPPMLALIGPQASGKTTLAKVIYLFESIIPIAFINRVDLYARNRQTFQHFYSSFYNGNLGSLRRSFESLFGFRENYHKNIYIKCIYNDSLSCELQLMPDPNSNNELYINVSFINTKDAWINDLLLEYSKVEAIKEEDELTELKEKCYSLFFEKKHKTYFMPHQRGGASNTKNRTEETIYFTNRLGERDVIISDYKDLCSALFNLIDLHQRSLTHMLTDLPKVETPAHHALAALIPQIIKADVSSKNGTYGFEIANNTTIPIYAGSSGQQEAFSVLIMAASMLLNKDIVSLTVEEPEAGLFPEGQEKLVRALALAFNANPDNRITFTTHSPYIITALNNLLTAHDIATEYPELKEQVAAIIPETMWINPAQVGAYHVEHGTISSILSGNNLVVADKIDTASDDIGDVFDALIRLQLGHKRKQHA